MNREREGARHRRAPCPFQWHGNACANPGSTDAAAFPSAAWCLRAQSATKIRTKSMTVLSAGGQTPRKRVPLSSTSTAMFCIADM